MALLSSQDVLLGGTNFGSSSERQYELGTRGYTRDGRVFRYVKAGAVALVAGEVIQSPATVVGHLVLAPNTTFASAPGDRTINLTCVSSVASGYYNDGYLCVASGAGQGLVYQILTHVAVSTGATGGFQLYDEDGLFVAITSTSRVSLLPNKYNGVIQAPVTTATGVTVGVAACAISATQFGWIQTWGPCAVRGGDTTALGGWMDGISSTAGRARGFSLALLDATSVTVTGSVLTGQAIGHLMQANVDGRFVMVDLKIAP